MLKIPSNGAPGWFSSGASACGMTRGRGWSWDQSHIGLPAGSLLLPLPVSLPLSDSLMNKQIESFKKNTRWFSIHSYGKISKKTNKTPPDTWQAG